jgi:hypothetical protein
LTVTVLVPVGVANARPLVHPVEPRIPADKTPIAATRRNTFQTPAWAIAFIRRRAKRSRRPVNPAAHQIIVLTSGVCGS